jgi:hypothetical protein
MRLFLFIIILSTQVSVAFSAVGEVLTMEGAPYLLRKFKKVSLNPGSKLEVKDNVYTKDGTLSLKMMDGSIVDLGPQSHFKVKSYELGAKVDRNVVLFKGDSRFNVKTMKQSKDKVFLVRTPTAVVGVRGTDFNVGVEPNVATTVTVFSGTVACFSVFGETQSAVSTVLTQGYQSKVAKGKSPSSARKVTQGELQSIKGSTGTADKAVKDEESETIDETSEEPERSPFTPEEGGGAPIDSIREDTLERIQETVIEEITNPDSSIFDEITPISPPASQE